MLLFECKGTAVIINTTCKLSWKNVKVVIKHDLINWLRVNMDFYLLWGKKKGLIQLCHQYSDSLSLADLSPPVLVQSEIMASDDW